MNKLEQAARQALEALEMYNEHGAILRPLVTTQALREALAEQAECKECGAKQAQIDRLMLEYCPDEMTPEQMQEWGNNQRPAEQAEHEPVAWRWPTHNGYAYAETHFDDEGGEPLYAAPVRTKDLTDDEIDEIFAGHGTIPNTKAVRAVIAADREKNK